MLCTLSFVLVGLGVSAAGTSLLVLLATRVQAERRAAAATLVWVMMIVGFAVTAGLAGRWLDPFSPERLVMVSGCVSCLALLLAWVALWGVESQAQPAAVAPAAKPSFLQALQQVWAEDDARRFTVFVFVSMLAYSAQDLILEPFAGVRFGFTPGESTQLSGVQHGGTLMGMLLAALALCGPGCWAAAPHPPWPCAGWWWPVPWARPGRCEPMCSCWAWPTARSPLPRSAR
jgi:BCD family chlorophyll transporter-like MFS transporter